MNRDFEYRKPTKVYAQSKENQAIIRALNKYGRVPEQWELLEKIERLNNIIDKLEKILENEWIYYDQIVFNTHAEFDDEEQVNRFWQEYGAKFTIS